MTTASLGSNAAAASNSNSDNDSSGRGGGDGFTEQDLVKGLSVSWSLLIDETIGRWYDTSNITSSPSSCQVLPGSWYLDDHSQCSILTRNSYLTRTIHIMYSGVIPYQVALFFRVYVQQYAYSVLAIMYQVVCSTYITGPSTSDI